MRPLYQVFPDTEYLLSLQVPELAGLSFLYFRALPWSHREAVARCVRHWARSFPVADRRRVFVALMAAYDWLNRERLLPGQRRGRAPRHVLQSA